MVILLMLFLFSYNYFRGIFLSCLLGWINFFLGRVPRALLERVKFTLQRPLIVICLIRRKCTFNKGQTNNYFVGRKGSLNEGQVCNYLIRRRGSFSEVLTYNYLVGRQWSFNEGDEFIGKCTNMVEVINIISSL